MKSKEIMIDLIIIEKSAKKATPSLNKIKGIST